jgi:hypothetical protein
MSPFVIKICLVFFGIIVAWWIIMIPFSRFLKKQDAESERWTPEAIQERYAEHLKQMKEEEDKAKKA